jgi:competence protein ComEC
MTERLLILFLLCSAAPLSSARPNRFIIWNVGQGLWTSYSTPSICFHIDIGGEKFDSKNTMGECRSKQNWAAFSHWDWDHIGLARRAQLLFGSLCIWKQPLGPANDTKRKFLSHLNDCAPLNLNWIRELKFDQGKTANSASRVLVLRDEILLPGDSPQAQEKQWAWQIRNEPRLLLLGHHGSRTSNSNLLLSRLLNLKQAVASARRKRYGHPHPVVLKRFKAHGISVLSTEDWGNLVFELGPKN